jgi:hypothetical protein
VQVYLKELSSSLGSGNSWAAADASFDIALHSEPLSKGAWLAGPAMKLRGSYLTEQSTDWNAMLKAHGQLRKTQLAAHTSTGAHNVREVAKAYANIQYDSGGVAYQLATGGYSSNMSSPGRTSTGIALVNYSSLTTPTQAFVCPDYQRFAAGDNTARYVMHAAQSSSTRTTVYVYQYDPVAKTWARADADFFIAVHGG